MALNKEERLTLKGLLKLGEDPKHLAEDYNIPISTIQTIKRENDKEIEEELVTKAMNVSPEILAGVLETAKTTSPAVSAELGNALTGVEGLHKLDGKFQSTMSGVLRRFDECLADPNLSLRDIKLISDTTASAFEKIFNSGTNIHIGDNNSQSNQQMSIFKNRMGV